MFFDLYFDWLDFLFLGIEFRLFDCCDSYSIMVYQ
jgi:hypothetical protein